MLDDAQVLSKEGAQIVDANLQSFEGKCRGVTGKLWDFALSS